MSLTQTGFRVIGETGKLKNCNSWAEYERPGSSATANMCNGGWYRGEYYNECASKADCLAQTMQNLRAANTDQKRHLMVHTNEAKPFGNQQNSVITGATPNLADRIQGWGAWATTAPKADPKTDPRASLRSVVGMPTPMQVSTSLPFPVAPPSEWPGAMRTPYAGPTPAHAGGVTPTFLPEDDESVWSRLGKNIFQGWIGSTGWHTFDYARTVDLFGRRRKNQ